MIGEIAAGIALGPTLLGALPGDPSSELFPADALGRAAADRPARARAVHVHRRLGPRPEARPPPASARRPPSRSPRSSCRSRSGSRSPPICTRLTTWSRAQRCPFWPFALFVGAALVADGLPGARAHPAGDRARGDAARGARADRRRRRRRHRLERARGRARPCSRRAAPGTTCGSWSRARCSSCVGRSSSCGPLLAPAAAARRRRARRSCCPSALVGAYATDAIGIHAVFGAFLVGAAMPRPRRDDATHRAAPSPRRP